MTIYHPDNRKELVEFTKSMLRILSSSCDLDYNSLLNKIVEADVFDIRTHATLINTVPDNTTAVTNKSDQDKQCVAYIMKCGTKTRCSLSCIKSETFCGKHTKMASTSGLKYGSIQSEKDQTKDQTTKPVLNKTHERSKELHIIYIHDKQLLYDYNSNQVYSFEANPKHIGSFDENAQRLILT